MTPEQKLAALFAAEAPPRRDYAFQIAVAERIARRRAWLTVAALLPWMVVSGIVLWALHPVLETVSGDLVPMIQPVALIVAGAVVAAGVGLWLTNSLQRRVTVAATPK
jgi:drug/metabolite transporter (DMT)-like permease